MNKSQAVIVFAAVLLLQCSSSWAGWNVISLNSDGVEWSSASGISGGTQVGVMGGPAHAAMWSGSSHDVVDLNPADCAYSSALGASGHNQAGFVIRDDVRYGHAALWHDTAESWVDLHPAGDYDLSEALAVYGDQQVGLVTGPEFGINPYVISPPGAVAYFSHAALWNGTAASWVDLNPQGSLQSKSTAIDANEQAGYALFGNQYHAGIWHGTADSWIDMNPAGFDWSVINGANDGTMVGSAGGANTSDQEHACMWNGSAGGFIDLNPADCEFSSATAVAGDYQVGYALAPGMSGVHAGVWSGTAESWFDLQTLLPSDFTTSKALAIEVVGNEVWIAGVAESSSTGKAMLWHYTPDAVPEPSGFLSLIVAVGGFGGSLIRRRK